jgi:hypothetical protein
MQKTLVVVPFKCANPKAKIAPNERYWRLCRPKATAGLCGYGLRRFKGLDPEKPLYFHVSASRPAGKVKAGLASVSAVVNAAGQPVWQDNYGSVVRPAIEAAAQMAFGKPSADQTGARTMRRLYWWVTQ